MGDSRGAPVRALWLDEMEGVARRGREARYAAGFPLVSPFYHKKTEAATRMCLDLTLCEG